MEPNANSTRPMNDEGSVGPVIATIIILAVVVLGGLYFWHERKAADEAAGMQTATSTDASSIQNQSSSDTTGSIQSDLKSTDTTTVDSQMNAS